MVDTPLTFSQYTRMVEQILVRKDFYSFLIEGDVRVSRQRVDPFGIALCFVGTHSNPTPDQLELFARVHHLAEEVQERWHIRDNSDCPCHEAKRRREIERQTTETDQQQA